MFHAGVAGVSRHGNYSFPSRKFQYPQLETPVSHRGNWNSQPRNKRFRRRILCHRYVLQISLSATYLQRYLQRYKLLYTRPLSLFCCRWQILFYFSNFIEVLFFKAYRSSTTLSVGKKVKTNRHSPSR